MLYKNNSTAVTLPFYINDLNNASENFKILFTDHANFELKEREHIQKKPTSKK